MKKILFTLATVAALALAITSQTEAAPHAAHNTAHNTVHNTAHNTSHAVVQHNNTVHVNKTVVTHTKVVNHSISPLRTGRYANYHLSHGTRFAQGYFYRGRNHSHWGVQRWDPRYRCECYWDPCVLCWYYFCVPDNCYYPVSYCPYRIYSWGPAVVQPGIPVSPDVGPQDVVPQQTDALPPIPEPLPQQS